MAASALGLLFDLVQIRLLNSYLDDPFDNVEKVERRDDLSQLAALVWFAA